MKRLRMAIVALAVLVSGALFMSVSPKASAAATGSSSCSAGGGVDGCVILIVNLSPSSGSVPTSGLTVTATRKTALTVNGKASPDNSFTLSKVSTTQYSSIKGVDGVRAPYYSGSCSPSDYDTETFNITVKQGSTQIGSTTGVLLCDGLKETSSGSFTWSKTASVTVTPKGQTATKAGMKGNTTYKNDLTGATGNCSTASFVVITDGPDKLSTSHAVQASVDGNGNYATNGNALTPGSGYTVKLTCYDKTDTNLANVYIGSQSNVTVKAGMTTVDFKNTSSADQYTGETTCTGDGSELNADGKCVNENDAVDCDAGGFDWIVCPAIKILLKGANTLDGFIMNQMNVDVTGIFDNTDNADSTQGGYYKAWSQFRIIATALLIIGGLVMVASTALGFEFLDAYTIRKTLPRVLIAIIGISLSWPLMRLVVNFFDTVGFDIRAIMYHPFLDMQGTIGVSTGLLSSATVIGAFLLMGPVALTFLLTAFMAIFVGFVILILRQAAIIMLIILAPVAIACYILPNTQKVWKLWYDNFLGLLLMFPIISALIAAGHIFATVSINANPGNGPKAVVGQAIALVAYFIPYFLLPMAARMATGVIGNIAGFVNDRHKGVFDRLKGARQKATEENMHAFKQGFNRTRLGTALESGKHQRIARREAWGSGAVGVGGIGSARYRTAMHNTEMGHLAGAAAEAIKNNPSAAANDDANKIARNAKSRDDFIQRYMAMGKSRDEAIDQMTYTEQAFGTTMGSTQMKHTAGTAALSSNSSTDSVAERAQWMRDAVSNHSMTSSQAAALVKQSGSLASSAGFGDLIGAATGTLSDAELRTRAAKGFNPVNSHRMRQKQAEELAQEVHQQQVEAFNTYGADSPEFATAVADGAGIHDVMNGMTPDVRAKFREHLNGAEVGGKRAREWEAEMEASGNARYLDDRKTWASTAAVAGGATAPGVPPTAGGPGAGGGGSAGGPP